MKRSAVSISYRGIITSVRSVVNHTIIISWNAIVSVPWPVYIASVVNVYIASTMGKYVTSVVMYIKTAYTRHVTKIIVVDVNVSNLTYASVIIIKNRGVFYLDNSSKLVVLYIRVIIVTRIKTNVNMWRANRNA